LIWADVESDAPPVFLDDILPEDSPWSVTNAKDIAVAGKGGL
jgi:hypothetical protein